LPPNPSELLTSKTVGNLEASESDFELIVIDTAAVLTVADAVALAPMMDGVIVVVKRGTTKGALQQSLEQLRAVGACVLGVVQTK
jgi:Mrp family chromosome partitioning ATPase